MGGTYVRGQKGNRPQSGRPLTAPHNKSSGKGRGVTKKSDTGLKSDATSVSIPNAFEFDCSSLTRCHETGRLFSLPSSDASLPRRDFVVVERNITGIDDLIYKEHTDVWENVPRGDARVYLRTESTSGEQLYSLVGAVNGLRKFGFSDSTYGYPDDVHTVIAMEKEVGENGHLSAFLLPSFDEERKKELIDADAGVTDTATDPDTSRRFWVLGCRGVHIVLDYAISEECMQYYTTLSHRYSHVIKIARLWKAMLPVGGNPPAVQSSAKPATGPAASRTLTAAQAAAFHETLHKNMWTGCFQAIFSDGEYLVDYSGMNELRFYALALNRRPFEATRTDRSGPPTNEAGHGSLPGETPNEVPTGGRQHSRENGLCLPVEDAAAFFHRVGLGYAHYYPLVVYKSAEYAQLIDAIRGRSLSAGCVLYGADKSGTVVRLWREKCYPYEMERAARDAILNRKLTGDAVKVRLERKLSQQPADLRDYVRDWETKRMPFLLQFAAWLKATGRVTPHTSRDAIRQLRVEWFSLEKKFQADVDWKSKLVSTSQPDSVQCGEDLQDLDVIKFVGPQGCGKSTLSCALYALLQKAQYRPRWVNQDELGSRNKFLASLQQASLPTSGLTHLIIDKMNLDAKMNTDYDNLPLTLTIMCSHPDGENALYNVCMDRVLRRGTGHRTIRLDQNIPAEEYQAQVQKTRGFVRQAVQTCETPRDPPDVILRLDVTTPLNEMMRMIWEKLQENGTHLLPPVTDDDINDALDVAHRYQSLLREQDRFPTYAALTIQDKKDVETLLQLVPPEFTTGQIVQREFHVTLKFFGGEVDPLTFVSVAERLGQSVTLTLERVVGDHDGVAITVRRDDAQYQSANPIPHVTISNRKGVPAKYSNDLISPTCYPGDPSKRRFLELPPNCTVTGTFVFRY